MAVQWLCDVSRAEVRSNGFSSLPFFLCGGRSVECIGRTRGMRQIVEEDLRQSTGPEGGKSRDP
jgi:hypothetical protein